MCSYRLIIVFVISINSLKHGLEEEILDPLDSTEPYVSPDIIGESLIKSEPKVAAVTEKSKSRYIHRFYIFLLTKLFIKIYISLGSSPKYILMSSRSA